MSQSDFTKSKKIKIEDKNKQPNIDDYLAGQMRISELKKATSPTNTQTPRQPIQGDAKHMVAIN